MSPSPKSSSNFDTNDVIALAENFQNVVNPSTYPSPGLPYQEEDSHEIPLDSICKKPVDAIPPPNDHSSYHKSLADWLGPGTVIVDDSYYDSPSEDGLEDSSSEEGLEDDDTPTPTLLQPDTTTILPPKLCEECSSVHSPSELCNNLSCSVCGSKCHLYCPYYNSISKGATFDRTHYEVRCYCGCPFIDEINWACLYVCCRRRNKLMIRRKNCEICHCSEHDHNTYECPINPDRAASIKSEDESICRE